jgi:hypothetical protein
MSTRVVAKWKAARSAITTDRSKSPR